jgi:hypothetical protein
MAIRDVSHFKDEFAATYERCGKRNFFTREDLTGSSREPTFTRGRFLTDR